MPHHSQRNPERHSAEKQPFLHTAHFELLGRLPSRQWWVCFTADRSFPGRYVAFSLQSATAKSWQSTCTKYSHTAHKRNSYLMTFNDHDNAPGQRATTWTRRIQKAALCSYFRNVRRDCHPIVSDKRCRIFSYDVLVRTSSARPGSAKRESRGETPLRDSV